MLRCSSAGLVGTTSSFTTHITHQLPIRVSLEIFVITSLQVRKVTYFSMDQMSKMQVVAKKMEKMLETSLQQLKSEQNLRKEAEDKFKTLETKFKEFSVFADEAEASKMRELADREEKILNLEASIEFLQQTLIQKEEDLAKKDQLIKKLRRRIDVLDTGDDPRIGTSLETVNKFEKRLSQLIKGNKVNSDVVVKSEGDENISSSPFTVSKGVVQHLEKRSQNIVEEVQCPGKKKSLCPSELPSHSGIEITPIKSNMTDSQNKLQESFEEGFHGFEPEEEDAADLIDGGEVSKEKANEIVIHGHHAVTQETEESWDESDYIMETEGEHNAKMEEEEEQEQKHDPEEKYSNITINPKIKHKTHCRVCKKVFPNRSALSHHEHQTGHDMKFPCSFCGKRFKQKVQAKRHEAQIHSTDMPYECNRCNRKFKSEFSWKRHQENDEIHRKMENWTPFLSCEICGKQFERRRKWCLDQHMLTHEKEKRFQCEICHKFFRTTNYLSQHVKACSGLKQEECAFCGKRFAKKAVLQNHERLHTGEKPYQCRICGDHFRTHSNYSKHGREVHGAECASHFNDMQNEAETESSILL